jgi:hypothetical protein
MALSKIDADGVSGLQATLTAATTVPSEGGAATTNVVQGLAKSWINHFEGTSVNDSLNCTSLTDNGTGYHNHSFVNAHTNKYYAATASVIGDGSTQTTENTYSFVGGGASAANSVHSTTTVRYTITHHSGLIVDQQMVQIVTTGDLA